jgi:hypothetical protein
MTTRLSEYDGSEHPLSSLIPLDAVSKEVYTAKPTVYTVMPCIHKNKIDDLGSVVDLGAFKQAFFSKTDVWSSIDMTNICVAGGSVAMSAHGSTKFNDYDVYLYGLNQEQADLRVKKLVDDICAYYAKDKLPNDDSRLALSKKVNSLDILFFINDEKMIYHQLHRNNKQYTLAKTVCKIQIICRLNSSIASILDGFDLDVSKCAFDGENVYFTEASKLTHETHTMKIDLSKRRRYNFESRIIKYRNRGFRLELPELYAPRNYNPANADTQYICLKYIQLCYPEMHGFAIKAAIGTIDKDMYIGHNDYEIVPELQLCGSLNKRNILVAVNPEVYGCPMEYKMLIKAIYNAPPIKSKEHLLSSLTPTMSNIEQVLIRIGMSTIEINSFRTQALSCNQTLLTVTSSLIKDKTYHLLLQYDEIVSKLTIYNNMIWYIHASTTEPITAAEWYGEHHISRHNLPSDDSSDDSSDVPSDASLVLFP